MGRAGMLLIALSMLAARSVAYQADLVPASERAEARDIRGSISIGGGDGTVHLRIENVNDAHGDPLDSERCRLAVRVQVNGVPRRVSFPLTVDGGDGELSASLHLLVNDQVIVHDVRVRGQEHRTLARAGTVTRVQDVAPPPAPSPDDCPAALASSTGDLADCRQALDDCESP